MRLKKKAPTIDGVLERALLATFEQGVEAGRDAERAKLELALDALESALVDATVAQIARAKRLLGVRG